MKVLTEKTCKCGVRIILCEREDGRRVPLVKRRCRAYVEEGGEYQPGPLVHISHFIDCPKRNEFRS